MPRALLLRALIFGHRWLGIALCLLFTVWFASGIVLMYWTYPDVDAVARLERSAPIDATKVQVSPLDAWERLNYGGQPDRAELVTFLDRPAYVFHIEDERGLVYADDGSAVREYSADVARAVAAEWSGQPAAAATFDGEMHLPNVDQWTVGGPAYRYWPLYKFTWPNAENVYVSSTTGEVVQHTTTQSRFWAYLGAIPHWLYFVPIRKDGATWRRTVLWSSAIGLVGSLMGLAIGVWMYSPRRRYRASDGAPSSFPYTGQKRWHTIFGLCFGLCACTWGLSGYLSMGSVEPLNRPARIASDVSAGLRGGLLDLNAFAGKSPLGALQEVGNEIAVRKLEFSLFGGEPLYLALEGTQQARLVPVNFPAAPYFDPDIVTIMVSQAIDPVTVADADLLHQYDAYYLDRDGELPLPVLRLRLNDSQRSLVYVDMRTARVVASYSAEGRVNRWLYHGLHSLDLPWLYRYRPLWDIVMLLLLGGGTALSVTAVIISGQFLGRKVPALRSGRPSL
jgi:hypothetical protein